MNRFDWDFTAPRSTPMGDHDVPRDSEHLTNKRIALLVCGGIAAMKAPFVARALRRRGADVVAFTSDEALRYVGREALEWATNHPLVTSLTWRAEHLSDDRPFDAYLVAPATYNTIAKAACGIADTVVTSVLASALGRMRAGRTQVLIAPTMHGSMHHEILVDNTRRLARLGVRVITPRDDYGKHNLPDDAVLVASVCRAVSDSALNQRRVLVTAEPTPVPLDSVKHITPLSRGQLGAAIASELVLRGADTTLLLGESGWRAEPWLPVEVACSYGEYQRLVLEHVKKGYDAGVFAANVTTHRPRARTTDAISGDPSEVQRDLLPTENVIDLAKAAAPSLYVVSVEAPHGVTDDELLAGARARLTYHPIVVAHRDDAPIAWIVTKDGHERVESKTGIARALCNHLEQALPSR
jgi:phosphopantothenoylcysteine decarboxylase/phosphopantothenate--cysteine ligase